MTKISPSNKRHHGGATVTQENGEMVVTFDFNDALTVVPEGSEKTVSEASVPAPDATDDDYPPFTLDGECNGCLSMVGSDAFEWRSDAQTADTGARGLAGESKEVDRDESSGGSDASVGSESCKNPFDTSSSSGGGSTGGDNYAGADAVSESDISSSYPDDPVMDAETFTERYSVPEGCPSSVYARMRPYTSIVLDPSLAGVPEPLRGECSREMSKAIAVNMECLRSWMENERHVNVERRSHHVREQTDSMVAKCDRIVLAHRTGHVAPPAVKGGRLSCLRAVFEAASMVFVGYAIGVLTNDGCPAPLDFTS